MKRGLCQLFIRCLIAFVLFVGSIGFPPQDMALAQDSTAEFTEHHEALTADESLQFELAEPKMREVRQRSNLSPALQAFLKAIGALLGYFFYAVIAALIGTILFYVIREFANVRFANQRKKDDDLTEGEAPLYMPDAEAAQILLDDVDKLAEAGNFADAIHTLLFRSIQDIEEKRPHSIRQSFTSREIADLKILSQEARTAFSKIGRVVEEGFFGQRPLGKSDFEACREAYVQFTRPKVWS